MICCYAKKVIKQLVVECFDLFLNIGKSGEYLIRIPAGLGQVFRIGRAPARHIVFRRLEVKLQADLFSPPEGLIGAEVAGCQVRRAEGRLEGVAVPLHDRELGREAKEEWVFLSGGGQANRGGTDLFGRVGADSGAEGAGQNLAAEADAEVREVLPKGTGDVIVEAHQERVVAVGGDGEGTTHYHKRADIGVVGVWVIGVGPDKEPRQAALTEVVNNGARRFGLTILNNTNRLHTRRRHQVFEFQRYTKTDPCAITMRKLFEKLLDELGKGERGHVDIGIVVAGSRVLALIAGAVEVLDRVILARAEGK